VSAVELQATTTNDNRGAPHFHVGPSQRVDLDAATDAVSDLLHALGLDLQTEDLRDTPRRVAMSFVELLTPKPFTMTTFPNDSAYDEMVIVRDVAFHSLCAHHLLPFVGTAHVAYIPGQRVVGLSKLARVVEYFARKPQTQERLTNEIADAVESTLAPRGVGVVMEASHLCMSLRGVQAPGARTVTSAVTGLFRDDPTTRSEFLMLAGARAR